MELADQLSFLVLSYSAAKKQHSIRIVASLAEALSVWTSSTRISPLFGVPAYDTASASPDSFAGQHSVFFVGPVDPIRVTEAGANCRVWLSLGTFNLLIVAKGTKRSASLEKWLKESKIRHELWKIKDGIVADFKFGTVVETNSAPEWRQELAHLSTATVAPELREAVGEYCPLMASALSRSTVAIPSLFPDLLSVHKFMLESLETRNSKGDDVYEMLGLLTTVNAGLARFTSQTFSGTSPISETECHFWTHSLLGTGIANLALHRLRSFVQETLGAERIPQRLEKLEAVTEQVPDLANLPASDEFWYRDHLGSTTLTPEDLSEPLFPLITYFSGRDGFKSTLNTLSAPLIVISSCNSLRWTLMTLTHEISHSIIRGVLGIIYPDSRQPEDITSALSLLKNRGIYPTLLDSVRATTLRTIIAMQQKEEERGGSKTTVFDKHNLSILLDRWYHELEEIITHVFDLLYFYGRNIEKYIEGIWMSWSVIPNIGNRVPEYVLRTLCATLSLHLRRGAKAEEICRDQVVRVLEDLAARREGGPYVPLALSYIKDHWEDEIKERLIVRKRLVLVVNGFLYSKTIASKFLGETRLVGKKSRREGYPLRVKKLEGNKVDNPFHFIETYTDSKFPAAAHAAWLLYILAFSVTNGSVIDARQ